MDACLQKVLQCFYKEKSVSPSVQLIGDLRFRPFRNAWMLEELSIPWKNVNMIPWSDDLYQLNPFGRIPTLLIDDFVLYDSAAINSYLAERFQSERGLQLIPMPGTAARARYDQFLFTIMIDIDALGLWIHRKHYDLPKYNEWLKDGIKQRKYDEVPAVLDSAKANFELAIKVMAGELKEKTYLLGETFTAVDIMLTCCLEWAQAIGWFNPEQKNEHKSLVDYYALCRSRSAYKTVWTRRAKLPITHPVFSTFVPLSQSPPDDCVRG